MAISQNDVDIIERRRKGLDLPRYGVPRVRVKLEVWNPGGTSIPGCPTRVRGTKILEMYEDDFDNLCRTKVEEKWEIWEQCKQRFEDFVKEEVTRRMPGKRSTAELYDAPIDPGTEQERNKNEHLVRQTTTQNPELYFASLAGRGVRPLRYAKVIEQLEPLEEPSRSSPAWVKGLVEQLQDGKSVSSSDITTLAAKMEELERKNAQLEERLKRKR